MAGQYLTVLINEKLVFPITVFLNASNIFEEKNIENDEQNNIVVNNELFQLYKPTYKLLISNNDLEKLFQFLKDDLTFVFTDLFSKQENLRKLIRLKINAKSENDYSIDNFHYLLEDLTLKSYNFVHIDSLEKKSDVNLNFDRIYKLGKVDFAIRIDSPVWCLLLLIKDYTKLPNIEEEYINIQEFESHDMRVIKADKRLVPKILIEEEPEGELVLEQQQDLKPDIEFNYQKLEFLDSKNIVQIIIINKKKK